MKKALKKAILLLMLLAVIIAFLDFAYALDTGDGIRINEIMYNPEGNDNNKEFIEIYMETPVNLSGWIIADKASEDVLELIQHSESNYALIVESGFDITGINAAVYSAGATIGNNLDNTADEIFFFMPNATMVASAHYDCSIANNNGKSIEYIDSQWLESIETGGTPGQENTEHNAEDNGNDNNTINNTTNQTTGCSMFFSVNTDKNLYNNSEKVKIDFGLEENIEDFIIEYWAEDLAGNIAKAKYNTTNKNQKSWTPNIDEADKSFYVKANLYADCEQQDILLNSKKLITVQGEAKSDESSIVIRDVYIGDDETIEFGKPLRIKLDIYKGDESSSTVEIWIEDLDSSEKVSDVSKLTLYEKFREYEITLPIQIKNNCNKKYSDGSYTLIVEGLNITEKREVSIEGVVSSLCPLSSAAADAEDTKISYELAEFTQDAVVGEEFTTKVSIANDEEKHAFTLWSYVYRGSRCYSGEREQNTITIDLDPGETRTVEINNVIEEAEPGEYKFKVKIQKDELKTTTDLTEDIYISEKFSETNKSISFEIMALVGSNNSTNKTANTTKQKKIPTGKVIYQSSSAKAKNLAVYFIIGAVGVMLLILGLGLKNQKKRNPKNNKTKTIEAKKSKKLQK
ncbi:hypothetical protein ACFL96_07085 [Thermoproteota archaeon]